MKKAKGTFKKIRRFIRIFDFFGESFTFRYKNEDKHATVLGGLICIIFYIIAFIYFIYKFIPFYNKMNFSLQYYTINLESTEKLILKEDSLAFAFGLTVNDSIDNSEIILDYLDIKFQFVNRTKNKKTVHNFNHSKCTKENFPDIHGNALEDLKINKLECVDLKNLMSLSYIPKGIYTEDEFFYYSISIDLKKNDDSKFNKTIYEFLIENNCKLQFYYTDITLNLSDYSSPNSTFINSMFLQLNPTLIQKKNIFYMNYHLYDDETILHFGRDKYDFNTFVGFSRVDDYSQYIGENRTKFNYLKDSSQYAKIYIRADNKKVEIKRRYEDFMEFYADTSALFLSVFWILGIIFAYYDRIITNHSISRRLFYFEGIKENKFEQFKIIKELIISKEKLEKEKLENEIKNSQKKNKICTYALDNTNVISNSNDNALSNNLNRRNSNSLFKIESPEIKETNTNTDKRNKKNLIDYSSYNILEIIGSFKIFFCTSKKFKRKINLFRQADSLIKDKLDAIFYIKNMILFELINNIYLDNKDILQFLSRPIIYFENNNKKEKSEFGNKNDIANASLEIYEEIEEKKIDEKKKLDIEQYFEGELYKNAYKLNSNILSEKIVNLILHPDKTKNQKKLIYYLKKHLKGV